MPTSAGKTRATELIIRSAFLSQRANLAVIVAPYRSLCHDIRGDLVTAINGEDIRLDEASDSYQFDLTLDVLLAARVSFDRHAREVALHAPTRARYGGADRPDDLR